MGLHPQMGLIALQPQMGQNGTLAPTGAKWHIGPKWGYNPKWG